MEDSFGILSLGEYVRVIARESVFQIKQLEEPKKVNWLKKNSGELLTTVTAVFVADSPYVSLR